MTHKVSAVKVREHMPDYLRRVSAGHEKFVIERAGKPVAALVPVGDVEQLKELARRDALAFLDAQAQRPGPSLTEEEAMDLANKAKRWARRPRRGE